MAPFRYRFYYGTYYVGAKTGPQLGTTQVLNPKMVSCTTTVKADLQGGSHWVEALEFTESASNLMGRGSIFGMFCRNYRLLLKCLLL